MFRDVVSSVQRVSLEVGQPRGHAGKSEHYTWYVVCGMGQWIGTKTYLNQFLLMITG